jgi:hypothetical protein
MAKDRSNMTVRKFRLGDPEADDVRMGGTVAERIEALTALTAIAWETSKRPLPTYTRATMPIVVTTLAAHAREP